MNEVWTAFDERAPVAADCLWGHIMIFHAYRGVIATALSEFQRSFFDTHWMSVPCRGWIETKTRLPGAEDGDYRRCVLARRVTGEILVTGWHRLEGDRMFTHWRIVPEPPADGVAWRERLKL